MEMMFLTMLLLLRCLVQAQGHDVRQRRRDASVQTLLIYSYIFSSLLHIDFHKFMHLNILLYNSVYL